MIVGAGPSGLTAALELRRRGQHPLIVDSAAGPLLQAGALALYPRSLDILEPSGVTEKLLSAGHRINGIIFNDNSRQVLRLPFSDIPHRHNFILALPRCEVQKTLARALERYGGEVRWGNKVLSINEVNSRHLVMVQSGSGAGFIDCRTLIGADGVRSPVREHLDIEYIGESEPDNFNLFDVTLDDWPHAADQAVASRKGEHIWGFIPHGEGRGRIIANHANALEHLPPEAKISKVLWQSRFRVSYSQAEDYQKDNAYLLGNAAQNHSPFAGRGMNLGIEDAATLAWLIDERRPMDYSARRQPVGDAVLDFNYARNQQLTAPGLFTRLSQKGLLPLMLKSPVSRRKMLSRFLGLNTPPPPWLQG